MLSFMLPRLHPQIYKSIDINDKCNSRNNIINEVDAMQYYLKNIETNIKNVQKEWDIYIKFTNTYELLYSQIPLENYFVSSTKRSRTFFVIKEILNKFYLPINQNDKCITTFHFSDTSHGMTEALIDLRNNNNNDTYITMKYSEPERNDESSLRYEEVRNKSIKVCDLKKNMLDLDLFADITYKLKSSVEFITIDLETENTYKNLIAQICYALSIQRKNGYLIIKFLDTFTKKSIDIIGLLSSMYEEVYITKPLSCKNYDSESYLVCKNFLHDDYEDFYPYILGYFTNVLNNNLLNDLTFFNESSCINEHFSNKIKEFSTILTQYQIEHIHNTLNIIATDKNKKLYIHSSLMYAKPNSNEHLSIDDQNYNKLDFEKSKVQYLFNINLKKCIQFCNDHQIAVNKMIIND